MEATTSTALDDVQQMSVSAFTAAEVFTFLEQNNLASIDLTRIAWRCRKSVDFYKKLTATLRTHHV
jgi:hypothetical protein